MSESPRQLLERLGIEAKKSLGQNYMVEPHMLERLAEAAQVGTEDTVLEIGPGLGALTDVLAERAGRVIALEIDERMVPFLQQRYQDAAQVEIVQGDILHVDLTTLLGPNVRHYKVCANLPYYITSPIIRLLLEHEHPPQTLAITVQYEVAQRITAKPGDMSLLAVGVQIYGQPRIEARLKPGVFYPRPNVDSAIVQITPHAEQLIAPEQRSSFFRIVRAGFSQPRKQLKNTLSSGLPPVANAAHSWLEQAGIDPRRRAETLSIDEWLRLYQFRPSALL
ncbi:MAG: ribosomal RNA small subunit methyltransferase A [Chloroflexi bacterium]|nr:ribosomal RNA small subunit methyltransferase A [Chloroflexota bacterium]